MAGFLKEERERSAVDSREQLSAVMENGTAIELRKRFHSQRMCLLSIL